MLQETELKSLWYYYGYGKDFGRPGEAVSYLRNKCRKLGINLRYYKIVINDECQSVRLALQ